jgi:hypothetical protein
MGRQAGAPTLMPQSLVVWKACWFKRSHGVAFCRTYFIRKSSDTTGEGISPSAI